MAGPSAGFHLAGEDRIIPWLRPVRRGDWLGLAGGVVLVFVFLSLSPSGGRPSLVPLPWDMAHHYLGALQVTRALQSGDLSQVVTEIQRADLYPPGHSLWLGAWLAVWGESTRSLQLFQASVVLLAVCGLWMGSLLLQTKWRQVAFAFSVLSW